MRTILLLFTALFLATARGDNYMMFLKDTEVLVVIPGMLPMHWTMEKGDCFPLLRVESKKLTQYASDTTYWDSAVLKWDKATFTLLLGSRDARQPQRTESDALALVPATHIASASTQYRESVKEFRAALAETRRSEDAADARGRLEDLQRQLTEQRQQLDRLRQQQQQPRR